MAFERPMIPEAGVLLSEYPEVARLGELEEMARERALRQSPDLYPKEVEAVSGFVGAIRAFCRSGKEKTKYAFETARERMEYLGLLLGVAQAYREEKEPGVMNYIYEKLEGFISDITSGNVEDFDAYTPATHGDRGIALLSKYGGSMEAIAEGSPELRRSLFYQGSEITDERVREVCGDGLIVFICGYGASKTPYEGIFQHFKLPVVVYELPHHVVHDDPKVVAEAFNGIREKLLADPLFRNASHIIGNSIGTMLAGRLAVDICESDPERKVELALIQTGASWQGALEHTHTKFADELREKMRNNNLTFDDFSEATKGYNPRDLVEEFAEYTARGQLDMSLFVGLGDAMIAPASKQVQPLLDALAANPKISSRYDAYLSDVAGHQQGMLFFLWLCTKNATEWSRVVTHFDPERDSIRTFRNAPPQVVKYHRRRARRERSVLF